MYKKQIKQGHRLQGQNTELTVFLSTNNEKLYNKIKTLLFMDSIKKPSNTKKSSNKMHQEF